MYGVVVNTNSYPGEKPYKCIADIPDIINIYLDTFSERNPAQEVRF